jgi:hypothetical protein
MGRGPNPLSNRCEARGICATPTTVVAAVLLMETLMEEFAALQRRTTCSARRTAENSRRLPAMIHDGLSGENE